MPIYISDIKFQDQYTGVLSGNGSDTGTKNFMGCVGDLMWATIDFYVAWSVTASLQFDKDNDTITIPITSGTWASYGFQVGDTIEVSSPATNAGSYTILSLTDYVLTTVEDIANNETTICTVYGTTPISYFDYYYNLVGNNDAKNFVSLTDIPSIQRFTGTALDYYGGSTILNPNATSLAWWDWYADIWDLKPTLTNLGVTASYRQLFKIEFPFFIKPFSDKSQINLIDNAYKQNTGDDTVLNTNSFIEPSYFYQQCLGYIHQIDAKFKITNPTADHSTGVVTSKGNTAWFDQFFPSGNYVGGNLITSPNYEFVSINYTVGATAVDSIDINNVTNVVIQLNKISGSWNKDDKYVVHFAWLPTNAVNYTGYSGNNQEDYRRCFLYDRAYTKVTASSVPGDMYGKNIQAIDKLTSSYTGTLLDISFNINLGTLTKEMLKQTPNYMIWVTPEDETITDLEDADRSAILCDVNKAFENTDDSTLIKFGGLVDNVEFYSQNESSKSDYVGLLGEYGFALSYFSVKENCIIKKINVSIVAQSSSPYDATNYEFPLEEWNNNTAEYWDGKLTDIEISEIRGFDLPFTDFPNKRYITRRPIADSPGFYAYGIGYGFQVGYQFWQNIVDYPAQYLAYHNNYWAIYTQGQVEFGNYLLGDYNTSVKFKIYFEILDNTTGITTEFINYADMKFYDGLNNFSDYEGKNLTLDYTGNDLNGGVLLDAPTTVTAFIESKLMLTPLNSGTPFFEMVIYYELGNKSYYDKIMTNDSVPQPGSAWTAVPTLVVTTYQVSATANVDFSSFEVKPKNIRLYSKLYY